MITRFLIFSLAVHTGVAFSSKLGFQFKRDIVPDKLEAGASQSKDGRVSSNFTYRSEDVISLADGASDSSFNCYYFAKLMAISVAEAIKSTTEKSFTHTRSYVLEAIKKTLVEYEHVLDADISARIKSVLTSNPNNGTLNGNFGHLWYSLYNLLSCETTFTTAFITDIAIPGSFRLNVVSIGDSNLAHFRLINKNGQSAYMPTFVTDNGSVAPGDYKSIESSGYRRLQTTLQRIGGLHIRNNIAIAAYSNILNEQFQLYSVNAAANDLVLSANSGLYDSVPLPLLTIFINYSIKSLESSCDAPGNVRDQVLERIVNRFSADFSDLVLMEQYGYFQNLREADFQESKKHYKETRDKAREVYDQILNAAIREAAESQNFFIGDNYRSPKNSNNFEHFKDFFKYVKTSDKTMEFADATPFDLDAYIDFDIIEHMGLENKSDGPSTKERSQPRFSSHDDLISLFGSCGFKDLVQPMIGEREISIEYTAINDCVQETLSRLTFQRNFFNEHGYEYLSRMIAVLAKNLQKDGGFKATPLMHNKQMGKATGSGDQYKDPAVVITRIKKKSSLANNHTATITKNALKHTTANITRQMKQQIESHANQFLFKYFDKAPRRSTKWMKLI